jgi:putative salt-induced outer membrane protein YdiY
MNRLIQTIIIACAFTFSAYANKTQSEFTLKTPKASHIIANECGAAEPTNWKYRAFLDISGKSGNSEEFGTEIGFKITKDTDAQTTKIYGSYDRTEKDGTKTSDETKLGAEYTSYFTPKLGWFVKTEFEKDDFENLDLRATPALGLSYRFIREKEHKLTGKIGAGYRYEDFNDGTKNKAYGGNVSVDHYWKFASWGEMTNEVTYTPSVEDSNDFLIEHDSGIEIPLGLSESWKLRLGVSNTYNNVVPVGVKELDTSYYARLVVDWQ